jgi:hypothetical protein
MEKRRVKRRISQRKELIKRVLSGLRLITADAHASIETATQIESPSARCKTSPPLVKLREDVASFLNSERQIVGKVKEVDGVGHGPTVRARLFPMPSTITGYHYPQASSSRFAP